jgi:hypothetical protein
VGGREEGIQRQGIVGEMADPGRLGSRPFDDENYKDSTFGLRGTGRVQEVPDLGSFSDKMSSMRWEQIPD